MACACGGRGGGGWEGAGEGPRHVSVCSLILAGQGMCHAGMPLQGVSGAAGLGKPAPARPSLPGHTCMLRRVLEAASSRPRTSAASCAAPHRPCSNVAEFNRGDLFVIRYRAVQPLLAEGAVELV